MSEKPMQNSSETDWDRIDALSDKDIDTSDIPQLGDDFFRRARVRMPKQRVSVELDSDLVQWFRQNDDDFDHRMNVALRIYMEAHKTV